MLLLEALTVTDTTRTSYMSSYYIIIDNNILYSLVGVVIRMYSSYGARSIHTYAYIIRFMLYTLSYIIDSYVKYAYMS